MSINPPSGNDHPIAVKVDLATGVIDRVEFSATHPGTPPDTLHTVIQLR